MAREPLDRYYTPRWAIDALLTYYPGIKGQRALEPFKGRRGHIYDALCTSFEVVHSGDKDSLVTCDFTWDVEFDEIPEASQNPDWLITNPPYLTKKMGGMVKKLLRTSSNVALLLPLSFLEPTEDRRSFLAKHPPTNILVLPRITFEKLDEQGNIALEASSAFATYAWLIWSKGAYLSGPSIQCWEGERPSREDLRKQNKLNNAESNV